MTVLSKVLVLHFAVPKRSQEVTLIAQLYILTCALHLVSVTIPPENIMDVGHGVLYEH